MQRNNIEIFTPDLSYRSSNQTTETEVDIDYLAISNSKVVLPDIRASEGDYIRISGHGSRHIGIVTGCTDSDKGYEIQFKPMLALLDVDVHMTQDGLKTSLEQWLADIMNAIYRDSDTGCYIGFRWEYRKYLPDGIHGFSALRSGSRF